MRRNHISAKKAKIFNKSEKIACIYCGKELFYEEATIEHITPLRDGGNNSITNFAIACKSCNR